MKASSISDFPADEVPFFARLPQERREALEQHISICCFAAGERVAEEGDFNPGAFMSCSKARQRFAIAAKAF